MKIKFCGAADGVTGSCHMIISDTCTFLLDCGMFQGNKANERRNREPFPFDPQEIDFVILSHAHVDHCGRLPLLVKQGFSGPVYCTDATADLLDVMLRDCAYIQKKETEYQNKKADRLGRPGIEPLYTEEDAKRVMKYVKPVLYGSEKQPAEGVTVRFTEAGHILGSAAVELWADGVKLVFSGDIGVADRPILRDPQPIQEADIVVMETTYGNRTHPMSDQSVNQLAAIVMNTVRRGGTAVIPAFAVGRTQELIYYFHRLLYENEEFSSVMKNIRFYVDSPMAEAATEVFKRNAQVFDSESRDLITRGDHPISFPNLRFVKTVEESQALNIDKSPKVIMSASGMCEAGRIKHHLKHNLWNPLNSVIFVGYQAEGTLGRLIVDGKDNVRILGEQIYVGAQIYYLKGFSGHADKYGLISWLSAFDPQPDKVFLVHGDEKSKTDFAKLAELELGIKPVPIMESCTVDLSDTAVLQKTPKRQEQIKTEALFDMRRRLFDIHNDLEYILYHTVLAADASLTEERIRNINDILLSLEKDSLNLGSTVSDIINNEGTGTPEPAEVI